MAKSNTSKSVKGKSAKSRSKKSSKRAATASTAPGADAAQPPMSKAGPKFKHAEKKKLSTGKGSSAAEIGASLVSFFNAGKASEVERQWHHKNIESIEGDGTVHLGRKGIREKNAWWSSSFDTHTALAEGPYVGATGFAVHFTITISPKGTDDRMTMREVGVYTVNKGKIVREEFCALGS
ncbi:MAG: nuclear transport factor 2 family protein [Phycisphaerae bacterium]|nr:nuclear transport factor 2 family protein [Phycisphaerae bacterium]